MLKKMFSKLFLKLTITSSSPRLTSKFIKWSLILHITQKIAFQCNSPFDSGHIKCISQKRKKVKNEFSVTKYVNAHL